MSIERIYKYVQTCVSKSKSKIIEDSIVQGLHIWNVKYNVDIDVNPVKKMTNICSKLESTSMDKYKSVVIYAGGDVCLWKCMCVLFAQAKKTLLFPLMKIIRQTCTKTRVVIFDKHWICILVRQAVHHCFLCHRIQLSDVGQISCIERSVRIIHKFSVSLQKCISVDYVNRNDLLHQPKELLRMPAIISDLPEKWPSKSYNGLFVCWSYEPQATRAALLSHIPET